MGSNGLQWKRMVQLLADTLVGKVVGKSHVTERKRSGAALMPGPNS